MINVDCSEIWCPKRIYCIRIELKSFSAGEELADVATINIYSLASLDIYEIQFLNTF